GGGNANEVRSVTAASLGKIRSGNLTLRLVVSPREGTKGRIGFELRGPFSFRPGSLPVARIAYTQIAGAREGTATFLSTGTKAYAVVSGKAYELPASATEQVRRAAAGLAGSGSGLGTFHVETWFDHPKVDGGAGVRGAELAAARTRGRRRRGRRVRARRLEPERAGDRRPACTSAAAERASRRLAPFGHVQVPGAGHGVNGHDATASSTCSG